MTYIQIGPMHTGDERWIEAGADAFLVHIWAASWCDQQLTNGRISKVMAQRVALPVPLDRVTAAIEALLVAGFWEEVDGAYQIVDYFSHALPADEIRETQERWKRDKKRQRLHAIGNHSACNPDKCQGAMSTKDSSKDSTVESTAESSPYTKPNQTQPDPTEGRGFGWGGSAHAATPSARRELDPEGQEEPAQGTVCEHGKVNPDITCPKCTDAARPPL